MVNEEMLKTFLTIANTGKFSQAADVLFISQSSVSKRIKLLETELKCELFVRMKNQVTLSEEGKNFLPYAEKALEILEKGRKKIEKSMITDLHQPIRIAATTSLSLHYVPNLINYYRKQYPFRRIDLYTRRSNIIMDMLINNEIDFGIFPQNDPIKSPLSAIPLFQDDYTLVINKSWYKSHRPFSVEDLVKYPVIRYNTGSFWSPIEHLFNALKVNLEYTIESDSVETILRLVKKEIGFSFLPDYLVKCETGKQIYKSKKIMDIQLPSRPVNIVFSKQNINLAKSFIPKDKSQVVSI